MIELKTLKKLLELNEDDIEKFDIEQLRLTLGVLRYAVRHVERELNGRTSPVGCDIVQE